MVEKLQSEENVPKILKEKLLTISAVLECKENKSCKLDLLIQELTDISQKPSLDAYLRTNLLSLVSSLEIIKSG